ncbi:hypothetical protein [Chamaesiphon minutus]|uniref:DUF1795 domain-containing protein n=1 Tax=Chamaesiphon minutus (strain ATCC 27169 / PCC 6605) TaxID=1173020 RepID=K9UHN9_CHAP6|nr:hypothetical protein [Chamaesiphon minutus]AFY93966.1 hypothetical protein Cha6605_2934 [Chamaesiphon minutus PCC 6605]
MRFLYTGIGFYIAFQGLTAAVAAPQSLPPTPQQMPSLALLQGKTVIQGNGVEFTVPSGFEGGVPSNAQTKAITTEATKMFPSMATFGDLLESDPNILRAIAINTTRADNPEIVIVTRLPVPATVSLKEIEQMMSQMLPSMLPPEFKLVNSKITNVGSRSIVLLTVDANIQGSKFKESIGLFREGNEIFQVTYVYANANSRQAMPIFRQMIGSFKATASVSTAKP